MTDYGIAKKIKADLIQRAKAKKNYAKVLKEEGMASNRLGEKGEKGKGRQRTSLLVKDPYAALKNDGSDDEDSGDESEEEEKGQEAELMVAGRKRALSVTPPPAPEPAPAPTKLEPVRRPKGKGREVPNDKSKPVAVPLSVPVPVSAKRPHADGAEGKSKTIPSATGSGSDEVREVQRSLRDIKKEAFSKRYPPNAARASEAIERRGGRIGSRGGRGQPNMGARMGALLEQIKRTK